MKWGEGRQCSLMQCGGMRNAIYWNMAEMKGSEKHQLKAVVRRLESDWQNLRWTWQFYILWLRFLFDVKVGQERWELCYLKEIKKGGVDLVASGLYKFTSHQDKYSTLHYKHNRGSWQFSPPIFLETVLTLLTSALHWRSLTTVLFFLRISQRIKQLTWDHLQAAFTWSDEKEITRVAWKCCN